MTDFQENLAHLVDEFHSTLSTPNGEWAVKGFIDVYRNIFTISTDTKVISKIIEIMLFPVIARFAHQNQLRMLLSEHQNHYPDITFIAPDNTLVALDIKSTYRVNSRTVSGFTLGSFTGYFRQRKTKKNIAFPYGSYEKHLVLGVIYSRSSTVANEREIYTIDDLENISSVTSDFAFLLHEKWRIANDKPGSGNTKNIGSVKRIYDLQNGAGPFSHYGADVFDDYWTNYLTLDMARAIDSSQPYRNLDEYARWRRR